MAWKKMKRWEGNKNEIFFYDSLFCPSEILLNELNEVVQRKNCSRCEINFKVFCRYHSKFICIPLDISLDSNSEPVVVLFFHIIRMPWDCHCYKATMNGNWLSCIRLCVDLCVLKFQSIYGGITRLGNSLFINWRRFGLRNIPDQKSKKTS